jgi:hypothetical protein
LAEANGNELRIVIVVIKNGSRVDKWIADSIVVIKPIERTLANQFIAVPFMGRMQ